MTPVAPVLVAGGGPTGLVVALTLLQNHVPVRIIDKLPEYNIAQRGHGLWPRTFEVFHFLGAHEIHHKATPVLPIQEYKPGTLEPTKTFSMFIRNDPTPSVPYNNPMLLGQPLIESTLRSRLEMYGGHVEMGTELESFEDSGERVLAKLVKRKDGGEILETFEASYLIGADGAKGITRKQLGLTFFGENRKDMNSVVGDICVEIEGVDRNHWHFFGDRTSDFLMFRPSDEIGPDGFQILMTLKDHDPKDPIANQKLLFESMSKLIGCEINVRKVIEMTEFRPNIRMVDKFGGGRVFIAGDAAHIHSPTGGQGLNTCVQDALNLAWKVALVHKGLSPAALLESYDLERLPVIGEMLNLTTGVLQKMREASTIERAMEREKRMNMLGVNCRASPIVVDEFTHAEPANAYGVLDESVLVAGDRAPNATELIGNTGGAAAVTTLFDVFSPTYHTVLVFTPDVDSAAEVHAALGRYPKEVVRPFIVLPCASEVAQAGVLVDRGGHAYRAYLVAERGKKVVVVRPDGVVGAIVHGAEGLGTYFAKIFV